MKKATRLVKSLLRKNNIERVPDLIHIRESYLYSGSLNCSQYDYFLNGILKEQFYRRREKLNQKLQSKEDIQSHYDEIKSNYMKLLGPFPKKTPLNPIVTGKIEKDKYIIEKVAFESRPFHHVTALLYIPKGKGSFPAILNIPGHNLTAKASESCQRIGKYFAINGFIVLQIDPVCQGERCQICQDSKAEYFDRLGNPMSKCTTSQHEMYNQGLQLLGSGLVAWEAWDNIRSIDYLCTRPEVDITKIGVTGVSGGGTQVTYLSSLDPRIKAVSISNYIATTEEKFKTIGSQDGCQQIYSEGKYGIEEQDFLFMAAPLPILLLSTYGDYFSYEGSKIAAKDLKEMYHVLGIDGRIKHFSSPGKHCLPDISLETNIKWMKRWLKDDTSKIITDKSKIDYVSQKNTYVTNTGQVITYYKNEKSILDYSIDLLEYYRERRTNYLSECTYDDLVVKSSELIGYEDLVNIKGGISKGTFVWNGLEIEKHLINRDKDFKLPALIIYPESRFRSGNSVLIISGCFGKMNEISRNIKLVRKKLSEGFVVMILDVSNTGELRSNKKVSRMGVAYEFAVAKMCIYAGKTLLGYRSEDMVIAKNYLKTLIDAKYFELLGSEQTGPSALHTAFIDGGFSKLYLRNFPDSWETIVKTHFKPDNIGIIVPNVLKYYDLPDLIKMMTKTNVKIIK